MPSTYQDGNYTFVDTDAMTGKRAVTVTTADTLTLTDTDSHRVVIARKSTATQTFTIPSGTELAGREYTFVCGHASGEILINSANAGDTFSVKASEAGASVVTAAGTGIKNTAATNILGDSITLVSDGATGYILINQSGIWASQ
jgi:hypothetical protein